MSAAKQPFSRLLGLLWVPGVLLFPIMVMAGIPGTDFTPGPQPGDVYWEHVHVSKHPTKGSDWYICYGYSWTKQFTINVPDLTHATKAEICVEYWGGHVGTSVQRLVVNGDSTKPVYYPLPLNTPTRPECYLRNMNGNSSSKLPLKQLKAGSNHFEFFHGPQICHGWDWPQTWAYAAILRIYFDPAKVSHPSGQMTKPASGSVIADNPQLAATATSTQGIASVDFIGYYEDFDWEGNGIFRQWHYQTQKGVMKYHIGTKNSGPYQVTWKTQKIPDQTRPIKFAARIKDKKGIYYMTEAAAGIRLKRTSGSVKLGKPTDVPEKFWSGAGKTMTCKIKLPANISQAASASIIVPSWSARHGGEAGTTIKINNKLIKTGFGRHHYYSYDEFPVKVSALKNGSTLANFSVYSATKHHPAEILWPGPALLVKFPTPDTTFCDTCQDDDTTTSVRAPVRTPNHAPYLDLSRRALGLAFEYQVPSAAKVSLTVYGIDGRTLWRKPARFLNAGTYREFLCLTALPSGVCIAHLAMENGNQAKTRHIRFLSF